MNRIEKLMFACRAVKVLDKTVGKRTTQVDFKFRLWHPAVWIMFLYITIRGLIQGVPQFLKLLHEQVTDTYFTIVDNEGGNDDND